MTTTTTLLHGDCRTTLPTLRPNSVDAIVTDPPYGLSFMGKSWDHGVPGVEFWREALRVAKPGAHMLAFGGTRTFHRLAVAIEDAGWEIRDCVMWVYGSGFPKSLDVSKAIDKAAGAEREVIGTRTSAYGTETATGERASRPDGGAGLFVGSSPKEVPLTGAPATDAARQWQGWGTALKPAWEPIIMARKPLCGTVAENVLTHGTGGINVDGCRIGSESTTTIRSGNSGANGRYGKDDRVFTRENPPGRWPANLLHDGSQLVMDLFPTTQPSKGNYVRKTGNQQFPGTMGDGETNAPDGLCDSGSAARFFYCAKASKADRDEGCEAMPLRNSYMVENGSNTSGLNGERYDRTTTQHNHHPTVKPTSLMRYLARLITPPSGTILDPFMGSGSTGKAAVLEGFNFIGIELDQDYITIAQARIKHAQ